MWIYNTISKVWMKENDIPFNWHGKPVTCELDKKNIFHRI